MTDTVQHYLCNPLHAMPADDAKHHEPLQESVVPIYWRMKGKRTTTQDVGAADWKAENGLVAVSAYNYDTHAVEWEESGLTVAELDADPGVERCNADGTPIAEPLTQPPDTSETSMVEPKPDEPLKVGDWVETQNLEFVEYHVRQSLTQLTWPRQVTRTNAVNLTVEGLLCYVGKLFFRRVPPPSEQVECNTCGIGSRLPSGVCDHCNQPVSDDVFEITDDLKLRKVSTSSKKVQSEILDELITKFKELSNTPGNEAIRCSRMHFDCWADDLVAIREGVTT